MPARRLETPRSRSVFINCPFDPEYKPILRAMVFAIRVCEYFPFCALDTHDGADIRLQKIAGLIGACDWGIHDLSRVEVKDGEVPRFNMPLELGIHLGARWLGGIAHRGKRVLILDAEEHRYDRSISDLSGQDIKWHNDDPAEAIRCVRSWLSANRRRGMKALPGHAFIVSEYARFKVDVVDALTRERQDPLDALDHPDFCRFIDKWLDVQEALRAR